MAPAIGPVCALASAIALVGCDPVYPLSINKYGGSAGVIVVDDKGGGYREILGPDGCLEVRYQYPKIAEIVARPVAGSPTTYGSAALHQTLNGADPASGVYTASATGINFVRGEKWRAPSIH